MINHFRTVSLNVSAVGLTSPHTARNIHVDPTYAPVTLTGDLAALYDMFYPSSNLDAKLVLTQAYMSLVEGCGMGEAITKLDPRVTYKILTPDAPDNLSKISVGVPTTSNAQSPSIWLRVYNYDYRPAWLTTPLTRTFSIEQQTNTLNLNVKEDATLIYTTAVSFTGQYSNVVTVPDPVSGKSMFQFQIKHPTSPAFTSTSGKKWSVTFSVLYPELISQQVKEMNRRQGTISRLLSTQRLPETTSYDELYQKHFNEVYRLAGLYISLVYRMNALLKN